jgi:hypothetical protein
LACMMAAERGTGPSYAPKESGGKAESGDLG